MTQVRNKVHLYLLVFPKRGLVKVGKADDLHARIKTLQQHWGPIDYAASYYLVVQPKMVFRLEKALHVLLSPHARSFDVGDGKTEMFAFEALELALRHIELFAPSSVVKGIQAPLLPVTQEATRVRNAAIAASRFYRRKRRQSRDMVTTAFDTARKFDRLNRWLLVLLRRRHRIQYQYSFEHDEIGAYHHNIVKLRIRGSNAKRAKVIPDLVFYTDNLDGRATRNCVDATWSNDVMQWNITIPSVRTDMFEHGSDLLMVYFAKQTVALLETLPARSEAVVEEIPDLTIRTVDA